MLARSDRPNPAAFRMVLPSGEVETRDYTLFVVDSDTIMPADLPNPGSQSFPFSPPTNPLAISNSR